MPSDRSPISQELATALYQFDASCRVIARLQKERDEARATLAAAPMVRQATLIGDGNDADLEPSFARPVQGAKRGVEGGDGGGKKAKGGMTADVVQKMIDTAAVLSKGRKKRPMPASLAAPEALAGLKLADTVPLHKAATPGINAVAISPANPSVFVTAGSDKTVCVYNKAEGRKARREGPAHACSREDSLFFLREATSAWAAGRESYSPASPAGLAPRRLAGPPAPAPARTAARDPLGPY